MSRREFLRLAAGSAVLNALGGSLVGCSARAANGPSSLPPPGGAPRAICFDVLTLFDPRSVVQAAETVVGEQAAPLCEQWRVRQFEYSWLRAAAGRYVDFEIVTRDALIYAARSRNVTLRPSAIERLVDEYSDLKPWPDTRDALETWKRQGLRLAPLTNFSPGMLARLMDHSRLTALFDTFISTDAAKTYKPDPRAYALGPAMLGLHREEIVFAAFGGWDAAGASWFGFRTFWVNRLAASSEELPPGLSATGTTFAELGAFIAASTGAVTGRAGST